jgi:hypothetical protein
MKRIFMLFGILSILNSCSTFSNKKINVNISNNFEEIIIKNETKGHVYGLYCKINGIINGYLEIEFTNGENLSETIIPENGIINFIYEGDWYSDEFIIKISPNESANGYINIIYNFKTIPEYKSLRY